MDAASAAKLVSALDAELARRRKNRDAAEEARWEQDYDGDVMTLFALKLDRFVNRLDKPSSGPPPAWWLRMSEHERVVNERQLEELADGVARLVEVATRLCDREEAEERGEPARRPLILPPHKRVRGWHMARSACIGNGA